MADITFTNQASSLLNTTITPTSLTIELEAGYGARFPSIGGSEYFLVALEDNAGNYEVVKITAYTSADVLTVASVADRGYDNTTAQDFTQNITRVELRATAAVFEEFLQVNGGTMTGDINVATNNLVDAALTGASTRMLAGQIVNVPLRGLLDTSTNEVAVPVNGTSRATVGGADIVAVGDDIIALLDTAGTIDFNSATAAVLIGTNTGAYLEIGSNAGTEYGRQSHDDTDYNWVFLDTGLLNITGLTTGILLGTGISLDLAENELTGPTIVDFGMKQQTVSASTTTDVDYQLGSYIILEMDQTITDLNVTDIPSTGVANIRVKVVQKTGAPWLITNYPGTTLWARGVVPNLSTLVNEIDFIDLWTDDGGTTWNGSFDEDWK